MRVLTIDARHFDFLFQLFAFGKFVFLLSLGSFQVAADIKEVLDTFRVAAELGSDSLGAYVISMASNVWLTATTFMT
jgi:hypothetical protein